MPRLFVAIELPDAIKEQLVQLETHIPTARWVKPEQMHLTLRFIGEVAEKQAAAIKSALGTVEAALFELQLSGVGRFPLSERRAPRVLWVGITPQPALNQLQQHIEKTLATVGCEPEEETFHAHITLARFKTEKPLQQVVDFLEAQAHFRAGPIAVTRFVLVQSVLSPRGPTYSNAGAYPLSQAG